MSTSEMTAEEAFNNLTGYDEIAIAKWFGESPLALSEIKSSGLVRSLVFIEYKRAGMSDKEAHAAALALSMGEITTYYAEDEADPFEEESGKAPDNVEQLDG